MMNITGSIVALVTPMQSNGSIDWQPLARLIDWHIESGTNALVIAGTTGESVTLSNEEYSQLIIFCVQNAKNRIAIIAGCGTYDTQTTIKKAQLAERAGADALLVVTPYYNKPTQEGLFQHYCKLANNTTLPIVLYNVPGRTAVDLLPETVGRLLDYDNIVAIKEASGEVARTKRLAEVFGSRLLIYSGCDDLNIELMQAGARGVISVTANIAPKMMSDCCQLFLAGDISKAETLHQSLMPLHRELFSEPNPIPVKWALYIMGIIDSGIRLPLTPLSANLVEPLQRALAQCGIDVNRADG